METQLEEYILRCSKIYYGLTPKDVRRFAYELALANNFVIPETWVNFKMATAEWFSSYMKRHPSLSIRSPEATSLSRATSFNKTNVGLFFNNLKKVLELYKLEAKDIWNVDETGCQNVQRPSKIVAQKGSRQVGKATSAERGTTVTMALAVSAIGNTVPPMFIFPRVHFKEFMVRDGPPGCIGTAHPSGWMTASSFMEFIEHFHKHVNSTKDKPCLLLLDNHDSHLSIPVLNFCKDNGIILVSFPPHTSHRLQPLDKSVYGPFKKYYFAGVDQWMTNNPGKTYSIYDIPGVVKQALPNATNPANVMSGFSATGIMPFNPEVFTEADFLSSYVTDRPLTSDEPQQSTSPETTNQQPVPSTSSGSGTIYVSPQELKPYPKAGERKENFRGRKRMKSAILTETPVKEQLEKEARIREEKGKKNLFSLNKAQKFKAQKPSKAVQNANQQRCKVSKAVRFEQTSDESEDEDAVCLRCLKRFSESRSGQQWIQCTSCRKWAHLECGKDCPRFICIHCDSDGEDE